MPRKNALKTLVWVVATLYVAGCGVGQRVLPGNSGHIAAKDADPAAGQALARDGGDRVQRHFYAATGVGISRTNPDASEVRAFTVNDRVEAAGQVTIGVDLSRQLAVELHSADLGSAGFDPGGRLNYHISGASALVYAGKNRHNFKRRGLTGYARVGVGILENTAVGNVPFVTDNDVHLLFGAGIEFMTGIGLGIRAEGIAFEEDAQVAQLGLIYRTGRRSKRKPVEIAQQPAPAQQPTPVVTAAALATPTLINLCEKYTGIIDGVMFHSGSAKLTVKAKRVLNDVADTLSVCATAPVEISAHTDSIGAARYNKDLSSHRARSVAIHLSRRGIDTSRMIITAFGETQPIQSNNTIEGRKRNRRVDLIAQ